MCLYACSSFLITFLNRFTLSFSHPCYFTLFLALSFSGSLSFQCFPFWWRTNVWNIKDISVTHLLISCILTSYIFTSCCSHRILIVISPKDFCLSFLTLHFVYVCMRYTFTGREMTVTPRFQPAGLHQIWILYYCHKGIT